MHTNGPIKIDPGRAIADLQGHTLNRMKGGDYTRLVYLGSTRDYNSMEYKHDGLAFRWGTEATSIALEFCHRQIFDELANASFRTVYDAFESYLLSGNHDPHQLIPAWLKMQQYRMTVPLFANEYFVELYHANMAAILEAMEHRYGIVRWWSGPDGPAPENRAETLDVPLPLRAGALLE